MSKIFNGSRTKDMEFTASQMLDDARNNVASEKDMAYVKVNLGVTGNKNGTIKTGGETSGRATGGSFNAGFGSDYCVGDVTIPFSFEYAKSKQTAIMGIIADIQNKLSVMATKIQGNLDSALEQRLRDSSMRSRAIREAKEILNEDDDSEFDQKVFNQANKDVRAKVISDMSLSAGIRSTFAIMVGSDKEEWARSKGYKKVPGKSVYTIGADEKGLKKIYLIDANMVERATDKVYEIGSMVQKVVSDALQGKEWNDDISFQILQAINNGISEDPNGKIKDIPEFTDVEEARIKEMRDVIIKRYNELASEF